MTTLWVNGLAILLAVAVIGFAAWKMNIPKNRRQILSVIKGALRYRNALLVGISFAVVYMSVFMILGGKGGRVHILFGRWIFNTTSGEVLTSLGMAILVMTSMTMFAYSIRMIGLVRSGKRCGAGIFGALLAALAAFCP
jgi:hypothetical protein